jgi:hypothetical protein
MTIGRKIQKAIFETKKQAQSELSVRLDGQITGYASLFDVADLGNDIMARGAFRKSLSNRGSRSIRMLFQHDPDRPIGVWEIVREDHKGLFVRGKISQQTALGRDVLALVRDGALEGLSIGFKTVRSRSRGSKELRELLEVDLWEISIVTFPMLPGARIESVKGTGAPFSVAQDIRTLEHWLRREAGLSRTSAKALLSKGYGALIAEDRRDAASTEGLASKIQQAADLFST